MYFYGPYANEFFLLYFCIFYVCFENNQNQNQPQQRSQPQWKPNCCCWFFCVINTQINILMFFIQRERTLNSYRFPFTIIYMYFDLHAYICTYEYESLKNSNCFLLYIHCDIGWEKEREKRIITKHRHWIQYGGEMFFVFVRFAQINILTRWRVIYKQFYLIERQRNKWIWMR